MKKITILLLSALFCTNLLAQKNFTFNGKTNTVEGDLIATHQFVSNGKNDGVKEIYSFKDTDLNILTITEISTDKFDGISSIFIYLVNLNKVNKGLCYVMERTNSSYKQQEIFAVNMGMQPNAVVNVKSMNWGHTEWTKTNDPVAQIYFTNKEKAIAYLAETIK